MKWVRQMLFFLKRKRKEKFPQLLSIELSNLCNADCIMCPRPDLTRKLQNMEFETLAKVVNDCRHKPLKEINLFWFGDSLFNKNIIEILEVRQERAAGSNAEPVD